MCNRAAGIGWGGREREIQDVSEPSVSWGIVDAGEEGVWKECNRRPHAKWARTKCFRKHTARHFGP